MKKERKLKLVMNKVKVSNLNALYGGTDPNTTVGSNVLCATDEQTINLLCQATDDTICSDPTSTTADTKTADSLVNCFVSENC